MRHLSFILLMAMPALIVSAASVQYQYDPEQRLMRVIYSGGQQVDYTYDGTGNVLSAATTGASAKGAVNVRVTPPTASWVFSDSAGELHAGTGNQDVANVPLGGVDVFWKPLAGLDPPQMNPGYGVLTSAAVTIQGIYTAPQNAARNWTCYR